MYNENDMPRRNSYNDQMVRVSQSKESKKSIQNESDFYD